MSKKKETTKGFALSEEQVAAIQELYLGMSSRYPRYADGITLEVRFIKGGQYIDAWSVFEVVDWYYGLSEFTAALTKIIDVPMPDGGKIEFLPVVR